MNMNKYCENAFNSLKHDEVDFIKKNCDKMLRREIAEKLEISEARIKRAAMYMRVKFISTKYSEEFKSKILKLYETGGKKEVLKNYPDLSYRSIVERNSYKKLLHEWNKCDINKLVKLAIDGEKIVDIAKKIGVKRASAYHKLKRLGLIQSEISNIKKSKEGRIIIERFSKWLS